ncbi:MAG: hypothetical protein JWO88_2136, partial [Frankiales bacterium]|nr:hypothetical protein [Frankiales bacterium]
MLVLVFVLNPWGVGTWAVNTAIHQEQRKQEQLVHVIVDQLPG